MKISERKQKILKALIDDYIVNCEPISSGYLQKLCLPEVSSATIRSELGALEEMGYLVQPHKSAGRMPSTKAYRYYVDNLMEKGANDIIALQGFFDTKFKGVEEVVKSTAKIISDKTNYTSLVVLGGTDNVIIKDIKLVDIGDNTALVVIITDRGILKDKMIDIPQNMEGKFIVSANQVLNDTFSGKTLKEIVANPTMSDDVLNEYKIVFDEIIDMLTRYKEDREGKVYLEGADKIFEYKEFENVDNVKNFLSVINTKEKIHELVDGEDNVEISIKIGKDDSVEDNMAIVSAKCVIGGRDIGHAVVIGPERMDYKKVVSVLGGVTKAIENIKKE